MFKLTRFEMARFKINTLRLVCMDFFLTTARITWKLYGIL